MNKVSRASLYSPVGSVAVTVMLCAQKKAPYVGGLHRWSWVLRLKILHPHRWPKRPAGLQEHLDVRMVTEGNDLIFVEGACCCWLIDGDGWCGADGVNNVATHSPPISSATSC